MNRRRRRPCACRHRRDVSVTRSSLPPSGEDFVSPTLLRRIRIANTDKLQVWLKEARRAGYAQAARAIEDELAERTPPVRTTLGYYPSRIRRDRKRRGRRR